MDKTYRSKLKTIHVHQKHAARIVYSEDKLTPLHQLLRSLNALNVYQINIYRHLTLIYKTNKNQASGIFNKLIKKHVHKYPAKFSESCFCPQALTLKATKYSIFQHGPKMWNELSTKIIKN